MVRPGRMIAPLEKRTERLRTWVKTALQDHSVLAVVDQGVVSATAFLSAVIVGRLTSVEEFGTYVLGISLTVIAQDVQAALVATPLMVRGPHWRRAISPSSLAT